jgi:transposase
MIEDKEKSGKVIFKEYCQHQISLLPPSLEELIAPKHLVRVVDGVIERIDVKILEQGYKGGGASNYHPRMMLKVLIYAYSIKIYSCRKIDQALSQNIHFMWLSGMQRPDFRTINNFRSGPLKSLIEKIFEEVLDFLVEQEYVKLENYFVDGTKLQADANKHTAVWASNTKRYKENLQAKVKVLFDEIDEENKQDDEQYGDRHYESEGDQSNLNSEEIYQRATQLNEQLEQTVHKKEQQRVKRIQSKLQKVAQKVEHYEKQEQILADRRSYSKTDQDAIFMRMKDGQFLPAYNIIQGTENQFIINYTIAQSSGESHLLKEHLQQLEQRLGKLPENIVGDAAYGSEENYAYLKDKSCTAYLKYTGYYHEGTRKHKGDRFHRDNLPYDPSTDSFTCPNGEKLIRKGSTKQINPSGYERVTHLYESRNCEGCRLADECKKKDQQYRQVTINPTWEEFKKQAKARLYTHKGIELKKQRSIDVESSFGDIKYNQGYSRFRLRGIKKANIEWGLIAISHNLRKVAIQKKAV